MAGKIAVIVKSNRLRNISEQMKSRVRDIARKAALDTKSHAIRLMKGPKHGLVYRRGKKVHQASAPGEAPAIDTGKLANSIQTDSFGQMGAMVFTDTEYGAILEFAMNRPFMGPAVEEVREGFLRAVERVLK